MLEIAVRKREPWIFALRVSARFDTIRNDLRFADLLRTATVSRRPRGVRRLQLPDPGD
jgi:hypothetical protein